MFTNITTLLGGNGNNTFIGLDAEATFALGENAAYSSSGRTLNFSGFTTLIGGRLADRFEIQGECTYELKGGDGDDIFVFYNNARLNGSIDGGKGRNTLDYSRYSSVRNIILTAVTVLEGTGEGDGAEETGEAGEAGETGDAGVIVGSFAGREAETISVGFTNISEFIGSNRNGDVIKGLNEKSTWQLNGNTVIYRDVLLTLTGIEIIAGSEQGDSFVINGRVLYSLQGGSGDDSFTFSDGAVLQGRINGGLGTDELDFSAYLSASNVTLTAADEQGFAGTQAAITAGFAGIDKIKGSLTAENTLRGLNEASIYRFTATEYSVTVAGHTLVFANYHHLIAGSADDTFIFEGTGHLAGLLDGGLGQNTLDYSAYELGDNSGVTVNLLTGSATGVADGEADRVRNISRLIGSKYNDILIGNNQDNVFDGGAGDDYLAGNGGNNTFFFKENWGKDIVINASGLGTLDFTAITADLRIDLAQAIISDLTNVSGSDCVNLVEFSGIKVIKGGSGDDTFIVSSAGENRYDLYGHDGNDTFVFSGNGSLEGLVDGGAGYNTLDYSTYDSEVVFNLEKLTATGLVRFSQIHRIIGSNHNDTIIGLNTNTTYKITAENAGQIIPEIADSFTGIDFAAVENLTGGSLDDTFAFIGNGYLTGLIDGGKGQNTLDYSAYDHGDGSGVVVDLNTGSATAVNNSEVGGIKNIQNLVSSPYKDVFIGHEKANNTFIFTDNWNADTIFLGGEQNLLDFSRVQEIMRILLKSDGIYIEAGESQIAFTGENVLGGNIYNAFAKILGGQGGVTFEIQANYCTALYGGAGDDTFRLADGVTYDGLLDGQGGRNTLDYSAYSAPREIRLTGLGAQGGFNGRDELLAKGFANIHRIIGTGRGDSLYGLADSAGTFELGGPNTGSDDGIYVSGGQTLFFSGFAKLYGGKDNDTFRIFGEQVYDLFGGAGNDTFIFADNAKLRGVIDGEAGHNTLDYAAYTTTRNFYLTGKGSLAGFDGKEASIDGMFRNITALIGGEAIDSLSGLDSDSVWRINGRNSGTYTTDNRTISFSFIDTLLGGAKSDRFCFQDKGSLDGNVDGRSGTDTLDYSACLEGIYVNLLTDKASKIRGGISSIENVSGGSGDDEIIGDDKDNLLDGGAGNDKLSGGAGNDELRGGSGNDWLDGGEGDDVLYSGSGHNTLIGGAGYDRVIIAYGSTYHYP